MRHWEISLHLFQQMISSSKSPDLIALSTVVDACSRASKQKQAVHFRQLWCQPCHENSMAEVLRVVRHRCRIMEMRKYLPPKKCSLGGIFWVKVTKRTTCPFWLHRIVENCYPLSFVICLTQQPLTYSLFMQSLVICF